MKINVKKSIITVVAAGTILGASLVANNSIHSSAADPAAFKVNNNVKVIKKHGFMVLNQKEGKDDSTIVARVKDISNGEYLTAVNVFDKNDNVDILKEKFHKGDVLLI